MGTWGPREGPGLAGSVTGALAEPGRSRHRAGVYSPEPLRHLRLRPVLKWLYRRFFHMSPVDDQHDSSAAIYPNCGPSTIHIYNRQKATPYIAINIFASFQRPTIFVISKFETFVDIASKQDILRQLHVN